MPHKDPIAAAAYKKAYHLVHHEKHLATARKQRAARVTPEQKEAWHRYQRERMLLQRYGIGLLDYDKLFAEQGGVCAICKAVSTGCRKRYLDIDHDHATGQVRGLLCGACNKSLGVLENKAWCRQAEEYLGRWRNVEYDPK